MTAVVNTQELAQFIRIEGLIPDIKPAGASRAKEVVGTGDNSNTLFYLDQPFVLDNTLTLSQGTTEATEVDLTETTHYTID